MKKTRELEAVATGVTHALHLLVGLLVVIIAVALALVESPVAYRLTGVAAVVCFAVLYLLGRQWVTAAPTGPEDPAPPLLVYLWVGGLIAAWAVLTAVVPTGSYLAFPLFFIALIVLPNPWGLLATGVILIGTIMRFAANGTANVGAILGPVIGAGVAIIVVWTYRALWRITHSQAQLNRELRHARAREAQQQHVAGVLQERQRLAHDIHDTIAQGLSGITMLLYAAEAAQPNAQATEKIIAARRLAADNLAEVRALVAALTPPQLAESAVVKSVRDRCTAAMAACAGLTIDVRVDGSPRAVTPGFNQTVLRVVQSLVSNIVQHAQAGHAAVTLTYGDTEMRIDVVDNGRGSHVLQDPDRARFVLRSVKDRATAHGGNVVVDSTPGEGTAVVVTLPYGVAVSEPEEA